MIRFYTLLLVMLWLPGSAMAAVTINEVAWMGSAVSANHEWIELYNDGPAVNLDGWTLTDNENLTIQLSGTILANSFAVLERTSDESAPGTAFMIYTGALKNTGATLSLYRVDGGLEDQVAGGTDWQNIGGDNTTKETAQYTTSGWVTAGATPGKANAPYSPPANNSTSNSQLSNGARLAEPVPREPVVLEKGQHQLSLEVIAPKQAFVNQPVVFSVEASGVGSTVENSLQYRWNFGDANISNEKNPTHVFAYPGTYVVHVEASYATQEAENSVVVTVLPVALSLTTNSDNDIQINNDSAYTVDLSDYRLRGHKVLELPQNTKLLSRQTITIPKEKITSSQSALIALYDSTGALVASILPSSLQSEVVTVAPKVHSMTNPSRQPSTYNQSFSFTTEAQAAEREDMSTSSTSMQSDTISSDENNDVQEEAINWPVWLLIVLLLGSSVVILMQPMKETNGLDKHDQSD